MIVRGKLVLFDRTTINKFYELQDVEDGEYHPLIENDGTDWDEIKNTLCKQPVA